MNFVSKSNLIKNVSLAWPLALNAILVQSMVLVDLMLIANLGEVSVAALGLASAILAFFVGTQYALANGTQLILARAVGANDPRAMASSLVIGWLINGGLTLITSVVLLFSLDGLLNWLVDDPLVAEQACRYLQVSACMLLVSSLAQVMIAFFNGSGQTRVPLYGYLIEIPVNILISLVLIYGYLGFPELGLRGAAIGSLVAVSIRFGYLVWQLRRQGNLPIMASRKALNVSVVVAHFHEISPIAANFITLASGVMLHQMLFAQLDVYSFAAITLVMPWMQMGAQFVTSWALATSINISQFRGRHQTHLIADFVEQAVRIILLLGVALCLVFVAFGELLPIIYPRLDEQTQQALAVIAPIYILIPLVRTYNGLCGHSLRALGQSVKVLQIHFVTQWIIGIPYLALVVYFQGPLWAVFGSILLEECLKVHSFRKHLKRELALLTPLDSENNKEGEDSVSS
ncbi:MATE family efflux transporter [Marinomonas posidonica]|uniref:Multi antimicrobial extrusion protein MatE n=1 Tax=Marinomonas posidonica (strain CECT 7376 / NCIMB 14433 / IVIA-Po-181) TaxID=491952 RepID=F6CSZ8_MARPP|nr:MATE family efflux transporter [Marinomonas posidonica]AEF55056.1 multi antimicrobial extrusion protein MatE [Marinomonas posidonica IVIA-Po-181]